MNITIQAIRGIFVVFYRDMVEGEASSLAEAWVVALDVQRWELLDSGTQPAIVEL